MAIIKTLKESKIASKDKPRQTIYPVTSSDAVIVPDKGKLTTVLSKVAFSNDYNDLDNLPASISAFNNDVGYLTSFTETDPTVPLWAKQNTKPSYNYSEILNTPILATVATSGNYNDLINKPTIPIVPTNVSAFTNDAGYLTTESDPTVPSHVKGITQQNITNWNNKVDSSDLTNYYTKSEVNSALNDKQDTITDLATIRSGASLGATAYQKPNGGIPKSDLASSVQTSLGKADTALQQHQDLSSYADGAEYDSTNHLIYLKHGNTRLSNPINANDFIKDGMVDTVEVTGGNLVITFNTDSGKEDIEIPISDIFDASNYYTKSEVDTKTAKTTARGDSKLLYNGQSVEAAISNVGFSTTNNLLNNGYNMAIRSNSTNPFFGLKEGSNLWYAQAAGNYFYFGPTSTNAMRLDQSGNVVVQTGSLTANSIIKKNGTSSQFLKADGSVDSNTYLTSFTEIDPTVPSWAKQSTKPTYTASEVGALPSTTFIPNKTSDLTNDSGFITGYTETDPIYSASVAAGITSSDISNWNSKTSNIGTITGITMNGVSKGTSGVVNLGTVVTSETDPTVPAWAKAANKPTYTASEVGALPSTTQIPSKTSDLTNDSGFITGYTETDPTVPSWAKQSTKPSYSYSEISGTPTLANVATSGSYNDLSNKPTIPTVPTNVSAFTNDAGYLTTHQDISGKQDNLTAGNGIAIDNSDTIRTIGIPYGVVDSTSTSKVFTATVPGIDRLENGVCVMLKNGVVTSAAGFTININGLGAKPAFNNMTAATRETTIFNINYTMLFVYDATRVVDSITGAWVCYRGYDANTNTIGYQLRTNSTVMTVTDTARYYKIYFTSADGAHWVPASVNSTNNATSARAVNQRPINPFGRIVFTSANSNYAAGANLAATTIWDQYTLTLGYSFNRTGAALTLTTNTPVYVKCAPQTNGSAIMDADTPIVQALPTTNDGKIYIFLGVAYSATAIELVPNHPVYYHDGSGIKLWTGSTGGGADLTNYYTKTEVDTALSGKQATLVSGTSIKTVNSTSLLGSGNVAVQPTLVSGTNIKTINNESLLGSGNISIQGGGGSVSITYESKGTNVPGRLIINT